MTQGRQGAARLPAGVRALYVLVQGVLHLVLPLAPLLVLPRARREPDFLRHLSHRIGLGPTGAGGAVWVYAASLGEMRAASPLIARLRAAGHPVLLTSQTPAGLNAGRTLFKGDAGVTHRYVPLDLFWAMRLFLRRARPALLIVLEVEIWPAMLIESAQAGVPMVMANGNLVQRTPGKPYRWSKRQLLTLYGLFDAIFTRTPEFAERYRAIGVDPGRIHVVGELKYDQGIDPADPALGRGLRARWAGRETRVLMLASTVQDEEGALLAMTTRLLAADPGLRVLWVPRSPQRFDAVARALAARGLAVLRRSVLGPGMDGPIPAETRVILGDSLGEMNRYYAMADLVFVGASLNALGGHNIMEPMALGKPVVMGPSTWGITFDAEPAGAAGAFESLPDPTALEARIAALMTDADALADMARNAQAFADARKGASARTMAGLAPLLARGTRRY
ncbi:MAG: 3-deoxy-D-manno-octulosonic-acid transferase [Rhodobacteraceae bacterium HLUCCA12]|nr:MAG: 3-deoxy-D-manno-octulosonic-acid transferase [Rhodobacteraceae bacterium HLUCCA12]